MISVNTPSGTLRIPEPRCIGHYFVVTAGGERFLARCIDELDGKPKRMRLANDGARFGTVLQPGEYEIVEQDPDWED